MELIDADWVKRCIRSGLSSGEGLIHFVRDPVEKANQKGEFEVIDEGVTDKRLLVIEGEFAQVLRVLKRDSNTLSVFLRNSWDRGDLASMTRNNPLQATNAHISIVGHVTQHELTKWLEQTELFNGFANRHLWLLTRRSKLLPDGGRDLDLAGLAVTLNYALTAARNVGRMRRGDAAARLWRTVYPQLTADRTGLYGAVTSRAEAQTLRLSMLYALLDGVGVIDEEHLAAALALWQYADRSAEIIFGSEPEDPLPGLILARLREHPEGMTRTDLHNAFARNLPAVKLVEGLAKLRDRGDAYADRAKTGRRGAPTERWYAGRRSNEFNELNPPDRASDDGEGINSFNSFIRKPSAGGNGDEVLNL